MKYKLRLDLVLHNLFPQYSRQQLQTWIMQGKVQVEGQVITKAGTLIVPTADIVTTFSEPKYVSRAGFKLEKALEHWSLDVTDFVCLDAGLSTGGFTDCLLQHGAKKVYGVDVGYGQVHNKIRIDDRVTVMERTNLRHMTSVGELVDLVTLDLSFISVLKVIDAVFQLLKPQGKLVVLIKPQFEARREQVGRGGIITESAVHQEIIGRVIEGIQVAGFCNQGVIESPILGATGNKEFLAYLIKTT